jgi:hypothetical protein
VAEPGARHLDIGHDHGKQERAVGVSVNVYLADQLAGAQKRSFERADRDVLGLAQLDHVVSPVHPTQAVGAELLHDVAGM